jgi:hypothetical protein
MRMYCKDCGVPLNDPERASGLEIAFCKSCYDAQADIEGSFNEAYGAIRARKAAGGDSWVPKYGTAPQAPKRTHGLPNKKG